MLYLANKGGEKMNHRVMQIVEEESQKSGVSVHKILGKGRTKSVVTVRRMAVIRCRGLLSLSYPELGEIFGKRDHTTIINYCRPKSQ